MAEIELPTLRGEELYIPFVGAIIERVKDGRKQVLIQTRNKKNDNLYSGTIEIPGGKLKAFEDVFDTVRREVKEESGLDIIFIQSEDKREDYSNKGDISSLIEPFCITQMKNGPFIGMIFLCRATGEPCISTEESSDIRWIDFDALKDVVKESPEKIYTAFLGPLKKYLGR